MMHEVRIDDLVNPTYLRTVGMNVLQEKLGIVGATRFMQQYTLGSGDYTKERVSLLAEETIDNFEAELDNLK